MLHGTEDGGCDDSEEDEDEDEDEVAKPRRGAGNAAGVPRLAVESSDESGSSDDDLDSGMDVPNKVSLHPISSMGCQPFKHRPSRCPRAHIDHPFILHPKIG
eukprot:1194470-Prorocentrum_minimum.AAC.3